MKLLLVLAFLTSPMVARPQEVAKTDEYPRSIRQFCERAERRMVEKERLIASWIPVAVGEQQGDSKEAFETIAKLQNSSAEDEASWQRLGCVHILYPPGSDRP